MTNDRYMVINYFLFTKMSTKVCIDLNKLNLQCKMLLFGRKGSCGVNNQLVNKSTKGRVREINNNIRGGVN